MYLAAAQGRPTLTDKGYTVAGIGIIVATKGRNLAPDNRTRNQLISALLERTWRALERVTLDPWRIGAITTATPVLLHLPRPSR